MKWKWKVDPDDGRVLKQSTSKMQIRGIQRGSQASSMCVANRKWVQRSTVKKAQCSSAQHSIAGTSSVHSVSIQCVKQSTSAPRPAGAPMVALSRHVQWRFSVSVPHSWTPRWPRHQCHIWRKQRRELQRMVRKFRRAGDIGWWYCNVSRTERCNTTEICVQLLDCHQRCISTYRCHNTTSYDCNILCKCISSINQWVCKRVGDQSKSH